MLILLHIRNKSGEVRVDEARGKSWYRISGRLVPRLTSPLLSYPLPSPIHSYLVPRTSPLSALRSQLLFGNLLKCL